MAESGSSRPVPESAEMRESPGSRETPELAAAVQRLAELRAQTQDARIELDALRRELVEVRHALGASQAAQLREANEHLVIAALKAQEGIDTVKDDLDVIIHASQRDSLTGLPNRMLMHDRIENAIAAARRHSAGLALLFLDIDGFKQINDARGHKVGDKVLQAVAQCLTATLRESDTVSRHGGDEFLLLLAEVGGASNAARVASKIQLTLNGPDGIEDDRTRVTASIGIALYPEDGADAATLIDRADAAMYRVKQRGGCGFEFYGAPRSL